MDTEYSFNVDTDSDRETPVAIILAAGRSRRMGKFKQLLPLGSSTVIEQVVDRVCSMLPRVVVVLGHRASEVRQRLVRRSVEFVHNPRYELGMTTSVQVGVESVRNACGFMIFLGDQPWISHAAIEAVIGGIYRSRAGIIVPTFGGKRGHPVYIHRRHVAEIMALPHDRGLNSVTRNHDEDTMEITVISNDILTDMDTPEDYQKAIGRWVA